MEVPPKTDEQNAGRRRKVRKKVVRVHGCVLVWDRKYTSKETADADGTDIDMLGREQVLQSA